MSPAGGRQIAGTPFLVVIGARDCGKSSVLRAGLVPHFTRPGTIPGIDLWYAALVVPSGDPTVTSVKEV